MATNKDRPNRVREATFGFGSPTHTFPEASPRPPSDTDDQGYDGAAAQFPDPPNLSLESVLGPALPALNIPHTVDMLDVDGSLPPLLSSWSVQAPPSATSLRALGQGPDDRGLFSHSYYNNFDRTALDDPLSESRPSSPHRSPSLDPQGDSNDDDDANVDAEPAPDASKFREHHLKQPDLRLHGLDFHNIHSLEKKLYHCTFEGCERSRPGSGFLRQQHLWDHVRRAHNAGGYEASRAAKIFHCPFKHSCAAYIFSLPQALDDHMRLIHGMNKISVLDAYLNGGMATSYGCYTKVDHMDAHESGREDYAGSTGTVPADPQLMPQPCAPQGSAFAMGTNYTYPPSIKEENADEVVFTDSGYATEPRVNCTTITKCPAEMTPQRTDSRHQTTRNDDNQDDARTSYSAATTVAPAQARSYILELSLALYGKLRKHLCQEDLSRLSTALPELTKAFAIKIGHDGSSKVNLSIMYFIHKHHREVIDQLKDLFLHGDDDATRDTRKHDPDSMSILDKMIMWEQKSSVKDPEYMPAELFEGVEGEDEDDQISSSVDLPAYNKIVLEGPAYDWFTSTLLNEGSLQRGTGQSTNLAEEIRSRVLERLPSKTMSKRRIPCKHHATFRLLWGPMNFRLRPECFRIRRTIGSSLPISMWDFDAITQLSGESEESHQVTTVEEYFSQTWPTNATELLDLLQQVYEGLRGHLYTAVLPDQNQIAARICGRHLLVTISGQPYTIAVYSEQLAWLAATLRLPQPFVVQSKPYLSNWTGQVPDLLEQERHSSMKTSSRGVRKGMWTGVLDRDTSKYAANGPPRPLNSPLKQSSLQRYGEGPQRPPNSKDRHHDVVGFEIGVLQTTCAPGLLHEKLWQRYLRPLTIPVTVPGFPIARRPEKSPGVEIPLRILLDVIENQKYGIDNQSFLRLKYPQATLELARCTDNIFYWHLVQASGNSPSSLYHPFNDDIVSLGTVDLEAKLRGARHIVSECNDECLNTNHCKGMETVLVTSTSSPTSAPSTSSPTSAPGDTPSNADVHSLLSDSENIEHQDHNGPGFSFFKHILRRLVSAYQTTTPENTRHTVCTVTEATRDASSTRPRASFPSPSHRTPKRPLRSNEGNSGDENDERDDRPRKKMKCKDSSCAPKPRFLACPFWKLDPDKHWECFLKKITAISYVKQHLTRRHTPDFYCHRCFVVFPDEHTYDRHVLDNGCARAPSARLEGISQPQSKRLSRKSKGSIEDQWFSMWEILFPEHLRPASIYVDSDQSEDFCLLREFSQRQGLTMMREELHARGLVPRHGVHEGELEAALRSGLDSIFEHFRLSRLSTTSNQPLPPRSHYDRSGRFQPTIQQETPADSSAESGAGLESLVSSNTFQVDNVAPSLNDTQPAAAQHHIYRSGRSDDIDSSWANQWASTPGVNNTAMTRASLHDSNERGAATALQNSPPILRREAEMASQQGALPQRYILPSDIPISPPRQHDSATGPARVPTDTSRPGCLDLDGSLASNIEERASREDDMDVTGGVVDDPQGSSDDVETSWGPWGEAEFTTATTDLDELFRSIVGYPDKME